MATVEAGVVESLATRAVTVEEAWILTAAGAAATAEGGAAKNSASGAVMFVGAVAVTTAAPVTMVAGLRTTVATGAGTAVAFPAVVTAVAGAAAGLMLPLGGSGRRKRRMCGSGRCIS